MTAYFNMYNGSGKIRGIHAEGNFAAVSIQGSQPGVSRHTRNFIQAVLPTRGIQSSPIPKGIAITDERNIQHDKKVASDKKNHAQAVVENSSVVRQPGMKPALIDADTGPSNKVAHEMYENGEEPRANTGAEEKPDEEEIAKN